MLTEHEAIGKLKEYGLLFNVYVKNREWGKAHNTYRAAMTVAVFLQVPPPVMDELFGAYQEGEEEMPDISLFSRKDVARVDLECCIKRNMAYEDMALRKQGEDAKYYSDTNYCARCTKKRRADKPHAVTEVITNSTTYSI